MYEKRDAAFEKYYNSPECSVSDLDYAYVLAVSAFNAGWKARSDLGNLPPIKSEHPEKYLNSSPERTAFIDKIYANTKI